MTLDERIGLTFAQAEGAEPLPSQLSLREISAELSAALWAITHASLQRCLGYGSGLYVALELSDPWKSVLARWWVVRLFQNVDELPPAEGLYQHVKATMTSRDYVKVFDFVQFVIQQPECPFSYEHDVGFVLERTRSAYRILESYIVPLSNDEQAHEISRALQRIREAAPRGPKAHLQNAARNLSSSDWAGTVRESIHAVEAAAKSIEPSASTLGPALAKLQDSLALSPALVKAYGALYGYASDEKGVRHALVFQDKAEIGENEAVFMFGACASFVAYLLTAAISSKSSDS